MYWRILTITFFQKSKHEYVKYGVSKKINLVRMDVSMGSVISLYLSVFYGDSREAVVGLEFFFILAEVPLDNENTQRVVSPSVLPYVRPRPGY